MQKMPGLGLSARGNKWATKITLRKQCLLNSQTAASVNSGDFEQANEHHHLNMIKHINV